jgi:hypothetical protein
VLRISFFQCETLSQLIKLSSQVFQLLVEVLGQLLNLAHTLLSHLEYLLVLGLLHHLKLRLMLLLDPKHLLILSLLQSD